MIGGEKPARKRRVPSQTRPERMAEASKRDIVRLLMILDGVNSIFDVASAGSFSHFGGFVRRFQRWASFDKRNLDEL